MLEKYIFKRVSQFGETRNALVEDKWEPNLTVNQFLNPNTTMIGRKPFLVKIGTNRNLIY